MRIEKYNALEWYVSGNKSNSGGGKQKSSLVKPFCVKKGLVTAILVISLLALVPAVAGAANIIYVGPGETETTIQGAVNNATEGDTIIVRDGTYNENIDVTKSLTIRSENGSANCTVDALNSEDQVFHVRADYVNITGFTIRGLNTDESSRAGIYLKGVNHCNISNNNVTNNNDGIVLREADNNNITDNTVNSNTRYGIILDESSINAISSNTASNNDYGILLSYSSDNLISSNTASNNEECGIILKYSSDNTISGNTVSNNEECGIILMYPSSSNNIIYNNYFNNTYNARDDGNNLWNITKEAGTNIIGGSYRGGNYWSDYAGEDLDGDGLGNTLLPYNTSGDIIEDDDIWDGGDWLPLVFGNPGTTPPVITDVTVDPTVDIEPDTLNLKSKGKWITAYIELPEGNEVSAINVTTVLLNNTVPAEDHPIEIGDYDDDGIADLMVKFDRSAVQELLDVGDEVEITVTGELTGGTLFEGSDTIRVIDKEEKESNSDSGKGGKNSDNDSGKGGKNSDNDNGKGGKK